MDLLHSFTWKMEWVFCLVNYTIICQYHNLLHHHMWYFDMKKKDTKQMVWKLGLCTFHRVYSNPHLLPPLQHSLTLRWSTNSSHSNNSIYWNFIIKELCVALIINSNEAHKCRYFCHHSNCLSKPKEKESINLLECESNDLSPKMSCLFDFRMSAACP